MQNYICSSFLHLQTEFTNLGQKKEPEKNFRCDYYLMIFNIL